jgi:hypothetical protein
LIPFLKRNDTQIYTPTLTALGEKSYLLYENINLSIHIKDIIQVFEYQNLYDVVLIGYIYEGMVIGGLTERMSNIIKSMILMHIFYKMVKEHLI